MKKTGISALALAVFSSSAALADIVVWHSYRGAEKAALEQVAENFNAQSEDKVELQAVPHDAYADKLTAAVPRGQGPVPYTPLTLPTNREG